MENSEIEAFRLSVCLLQKAMARPVAAGSQAVLDTVADRLFERLGLLQLKPQMVLDLGTGDARHLSLLQQRFKDAAVVGADISIERLNSSHTRRRFWQRRPLLVNLDANQALPFAKDSFDLLISNLLLPWVNETEVLVSEINRVLKQDGAYFLSTVGPDTLIELRHAWADIDDCQHINLFLDMHDLGDVMVGAGLADPVMDTERLTVTYSSLDHLLDELTALGFINTLHGRRKGLTAATVRERLKAAYPVNADGGIDATLELVTAHGWSGVPKPPPGEFHYDVERLRMR